MATFNCRMRYHSTTTDINRNTCSKIDDVLLGPDGHEINKTTGQRGIPHVYLATVLNHHWSTDRSPLTVQNGDVDDDGHAGMIEGLSTKRPHVVALCEVDVTAGGEEDRVRHDTHAGMVEGLSTKRPHVVALCEVDVTAGGEEDRVRHDTHAGMIEGAEYKTATCSGTL